MTTSAEKLSPGKNEDIVQPYQAIANIYDKMMSHVEYEHWAAFICALLDREDKTPRKIIELGCGTGIMADKLSRRGYEITGYDKSEAMISAARKKINDDFLRFETGTFADFPTNEKYDVAICLYDSINYIMNWPDLVKCIARVKDTLVPGGIFIFDICTRWNSFINFRGFFDEGEIDGWYFLRKSNYSPKTHIHTNDFVVYPRSNPSGQFQEHHEQFIYSVSQIQSAVKKAGLKLEAKYDDISLRSAKLHSLRVHFLTRKI